MTVNSPRVGLRLAAFVFAVVCLGHLWRVISQVDVQIGTYHIPMWPSLIAVAVAGGLSVWMWKISAGFRT